ncbi:MAG: hypothetical protein Q8L88_08105 [Bacteroidota bacterium]|nr:hypothetical protein [Bacteroidota bacterium]
MKLNLVFFLLVTVLTTGTAQENILSSTPLRLDLNAGYKGIHLTGFSFHFRLIKDETLGIDVGVGYDFLYSYSIGAIYYLNPGNNQFFVSGGYAIFKRSEENVYGIKIKSLHGQLGYESQFGDHIIIGSTIGVVKYLEERFSIPNYRVEQQFLAYESKYFEIGLTLGYRFSFY